MTTEIQPPEQTKDPVDLVAEKTAIFPSKGEARRMLKDGGVQINKAKVGEDFIANQTNLLSGKYLLAQKGKKNYYLLIGR